MNLRPYPGQCTTCWVLFFLQAKSQPPMSQQLEGKSDSVRLSTPTSSSSPRRSGGGEKEEERKKEVTPKGDNTKKGGRLSGTEH